MRPPVEPELFPDLPPLRPSSSQPRSRAKVRSSAPIAAPEFSYVAENNDRLPRANISSTLRTTTDKELLQAEYMAFLLVSNAAARQQKSQWQLWKESVKKTVSFLSLRPRIKTVEWREERIEPVLEKTATSASMPDKQAFATNKDRVSSEQKAYAKRHIQAQHSKETHGVTPQIRPEEAEAPQAQFNFQQPHSVAKARSSSSTYKKHSFNRKLPTLRFPLAIFRKKITLKYFAFAGVLATCLLLMSVLIGKSWHTESIQPNASSLANRSDEIPFADTLIANEIYIKGRLYTNPQEIMAAIGINRGDPLLGFNIQHAQKNLEALPWVRKAAITRHLSGSVYVDIIERTPLAIWQHDNRFALIDTEGDVISSYQESLGFLPLVVGKGANLQAASLLDALNTEPELKSRVKAAVWISERRWNLIFDDLDAGITVRLPEEGMITSLHRLADLNKREKILDRAIAMIDLRFVDRMILAPQTSAKPPLPKPLKGTSDAD